MPRTREYDIRTNKATATSRATNNNNKTTTKTGFARIVARIRENEADGLDAWCEAHADYVRCQNAERSLSVSQYAKRASAETGFTESTIRIYLGAIDWAVTDARRAKNLHTKWTSVRQVMAARTDANGAKKKEPKRDIKREAMKFSVAELRAMLAYREKMMG